MKKRDKTLTPADVALEAKVDAEVEADLEAEASVQATLDALAITDDAPRNTVPVTPEEDELLAGKGTEYPPADIETILGPAIRRTRDGRVLVNGVEADELPPILADPRLLAHIDSEHNGAGRPVLDTTGECYARAFHDGLHGVPHATHTHTFDGAQVHG